MATIVSFLQEAVPAYVPLTSLTTNEEILDLYSKIARNVLTLLCRMVTNKESEVNIFNTYLMVLINTKINEKKKQYYFYRRSG